MEQKRAFAAAKRADTVGAVDAFLAAHPENHLVGDARALRAALVAREDAYIGAMSSDDPAVLKAFLASYKKGPASDQVRGRLRRLEPQPSRRPLLMAGTVGVLLIGSISLWLAGAYRTADVAYQQQLAALKAEAERAEAKRVAEAKAAVEAEAKRRADEAEQQRLAALKAEAERAEAKRVAEAKAAADALPRPPPAPSPPPLLPEFPWPPPSASASYVLPDNLFQSRRTVGEAATVIISALERNGYVERSFFRTHAGGVAMVTRLERINDDGSSFVETNRWPPNEQNFASTSDLLQFFYGLFFVDPGHYRVIVFILQDRPFSQSPQSTTGQEARAWVRSGTNILPPEIAVRPFAGSHCTVLVYEFASDGRISRWVESRLTGKRHLEKAGVLSLLEKAN